MSKNTCTSEFCCERYKEHVRNSNNFAKGKMVKTVNSKPICTAQSSRLIDKRTRSDCKKTTKSDGYFRCSKPISNIDISKNCGDCKQWYPKHLLHDSNKCLQKCLPPQIKGSSKNSIKCDIHQYYKNENYHSNNSLTTTKKVSLKTIVEQAERSSNTEPTIFQSNQIQNSDEELLLMSPNREENLQSLKEFRKNNYFECHSAKYRVKSKSSDTNLTEHTCSYRFYLNDRLFPVPIYADHEQRVRCMECHLPMRNCQSSSMIQAKVKLDNKIQDMLIMLPVKKSLIMREWRKKETGNNDCFYFGIVKLDFNGNSLFNNTLPEDSLALRYQKGYREFCKREECEYQGDFGDDKVIII